MQRGEWEEAKGVIAKEPERHDPSISQLVIHPSISQLVIQVKQGDKLQPGSPFIASSFLHYIITLSIHSNIADSGYLIKPIQTKQ